MWTDCLKGMFLHLGCPLESPAELSEWAHTCSLSPVLVGTSVVLDGS